MKKLVNGEYIDMERSEIDEIKTQNQKELLENATKYNLTQEDILMILAHSISITLPNGQTETADNLIDTQIDLPFKLGYKWELHGTTFVSVEDAEAIGTMENPIIFYDGVQLIENAFYMIDGVRNVFMCGRFVEF